MLPYFVEPNTAGTTRRSLPLYQLQLKLNNTLNSAYLSGTIKTVSETLEYENIGSSTVLGANGTATRQVKFNLENVSGYHIEYRVNSADLGWQSWKTDNEAAGNTTDNIDAIKFRLVYDNAEINQLKLDKTSLVLNEGDKSTLKATIRPNVTTMDKNISRSSSNLSVVGVDQNSNLTAKKTGRR